ncbi:MAG: PAS domain S-box protein [Ardenticatenales bacterium]
MNAAPDSERTRTAAAAGIEALYEQRDLLRVTLESIADGIIATDPQGGVVFLNSVAAALTGWSASDAAGQPVDRVYRVLDNTGGQPIESSVLRALRGARAIALQNHHRLVDRDGAERSVNDSAAPIRNATGDLVGAVLVFRDVTEREEAERAVHRALSYAEDIIQTLREPFLVLDVDFHVKTANRAFYETFQVQVEETQKRSLFDLGNGQWNIPGLRDLIARVLEAPDPSLDDFEVEHDFPVLGRRTMLLNARRFPPSEAKAELILLAIQDISERKQQENSVRISEVRYRRLFESAKDGILILNAETGRVLEVNPYMTTLLRYQPAEFLGKELWEIGLFKDKAENETAFVELQEHGYIRYDHLPLVTKDGATVPVEFVSNVYQMSHRAVIQCNIRDISDRRRIERQLSEQADALADAGRRKDEFLAMLSHELRNPLSPILYALQALRLNASESEVHRQARTVIERHVMHLVRLVDDLLEVSRITTGSLRLRLERVEANALVERASVTIRAMTEQKRQTLSVSLNAEPLWLEADATRLEQVVGNLLNNASKFTDVGGRIWLGVERDENWAVIRIRDDGTGIAAAFLPHIFELFTQGDQALDRSEGGLGIGLALVKSIVEIHGGTVEADSAGLAQGSQFVVRLPLVAERTTTEEPSVPSPAPTTDALRILIVDDSVDGANMLAVLLQDAGHIPRVVHSGPAALQLAPAFDPDVVLLDIGLPEMDGYEVARRFRADSRLAHVLLVAITGYGQDVDRQHSKEAGLDHHLVKPVDLAILSELLNSVERHRK